MANRLASEPIRSGSRDAAPHGGLYPVLGASLTRTFVEFAIFGYVPLYLYTSGQRRILELALITAVPAMVRFLAANLWGALFDVTGRLKLPLLLGLAGYGAAAAGLVFVTTGAQATAVVSLAAVLFAAVSPAGKALVSLRPERAGTPERALAWWLQLESWGWLLGSAALALRSKIGAPPQSLLWLAAAAAAVEALWIAWKVPEHLAAHEPARKGARPAGAGQGGNAASAGASQPSWGRLALARIASVWGEWRRLYGRPLLMLAFAVFALSTLASEAAFTVFAIFIVATLGGSESLYGAALTVATGLGLLVYAWLALSRRRPSPGGLMALASVLYVATYATMAAATSPWVAAFAFALPLYSVIRAAATWVAASLTADVERGGGMGALDGVEALAIVLAALLAGAIGDGLGLRMVYVASGAVALAASVLAWILRLRLAGARRPAASTTAPAS